MGLAEGQAGIRKSLCYHPGNCQLVTGVHDKSRRKEEVTDLPGPECWGSIQNGPHISVHLLEKPCIQGWAEVWGLWSTRHLSQQLEAEC